MYNFSVKLSSCPSYRPIEVHAVCCTLQYVCRQKAWKVCIEIFSLPLSVLPLVQVHDPEY